MSLGLVLTGGVLEVLDVIGICFLGCCVKHVFSSPKLSKLLRNVS